MKIAKVIHHGQTRYRVNDPSGPDGKRQRKFFDTREAAEAYVKDRGADKKEFGLRFVTQPPAERAVIAYQLQRLKALGWTLPAAVDFIEKHGREKAPSLTLGQVADEFLAAKKTAGLRPRYLKTLRASINRFLVNRREKLIGDITASDRVQKKSPNSPCGDYGDTSATEFRRHKWAKKNCAVAVGRGNRAASSKRADSAKFLGMFIFVSRSAGLRLWRE